MPTQQTEKSEYDKFYHMMLTNAALHCRRVSEMEPAQVDEYLNGFDIANVLSVVLCKRREDIIFDMAKIELD